MAITLFDLWEKFCGEYNTHQGGHVRPHRNFTNWVNAISISLFEEKFTGAWEKNQKIIDDLGRPFLKVAALSPVASGQHDVIPFPSDYAHFSAARYYYTDGKQQGCIACKPDPKSPQGSEDFTYETFKPAEGLIEQEITMVKSDKWGPMMKHIVKRPTINSPKMTQFDGGFRLAPKGIGTIYMDYLRKPKPATFMYTLGPGDQIVYDANNSQPLEWTELVINEFLAALGVKYGKFIREGFIYQTSDKEKATGV